MGNGLELSAALHRCCARIAIRVVRLDANHAPATATLLLHVRPLNVMVEVNHIWIVHVVPAPEVIIVICHTIKVGEKFNSVKNFFCNF